MGFIEGKSGEWNHLSADPTRHRYLLLLPSKAGHSVPRLGIRRPSCWMSLEVALPPVFLYLPGSPPGTDNFPCSHLLDNLILAFGIHFFSLFSFLFFTISLPHPPRLRQVAAAHLSGIAEHLVI